MSNDTRKALAGFLAALAIVVAVCLAIRVVQAEGPPKDVLHKVELIKQNQEIIKKNRKAYEEFMSAKERNVMYVKGMEQEGWSMNWATLDPIPLSPQASVDLDKLSKAVAVAETSGCTDGTAIKRNNCQGIMCWDKKGNRSPCYFKSQAASHEAFKKIWAKSYKVFPDRALAVKWTGDDHADTWLAHVITSYNSL